jgi:hypothetical protein
LWAQLVASGMSGNGGNGRRAGAAGANARAEVSAGLSLTGAGS